MKHKMKIVALMLCLLPYSGNADGFLDNIPNTKHELPETLTKILVSNENDPEFKRLLSAMKQQSNLAGYEISQTPFKDPDTKDVIPTGDLTIYKGKKYVGSIQRFKNNSNKRVYYTQKAFDVVGKQGGNKPWKLNNPEMALVPNEVMFMYFIGDDTAQDTVKN